MFVGAVSRVDNIRIDVLGQKVMPTDLAVALINGAAGVQPVDGKGIESYGLSDRELEILALITAGLKNQEIADQLFISLNTVLYHTKNIYSKLGVNKRALAIAKARELNLIA